MFLSIGLNENYTVVRLRVVASNVTACILSRLGLAQSTRRWLSKLYAFHFSRMVMMSSRYNVVALADLWRRSSFSNGATANRRKRTDRKCHCEAGLNQQALSAQVEASRCRGRKVLARREICGMVYRCQTSNSRYIDCEPFRVDAICWRSCIGFIYRRSCIKGVAARRAGAMVRAFGLRFAGVVCRLCGKGCLRNVIGAVAERSGNGFAARE